MADSTRFDVLALLFTEVQVFDDVTKPILQSGIDAAPIAIGPSQNYTAGKAFDLIVEFDKASSDKTQHWQTKFSRFSFSYSLPFSWRSEVSSRISHRVNSMTRSHKLFQIRETEFFPKIPVFLGFSHLA